MLNCSCTFKDSFQILLKEVPPKLKLESCLWILVVVWLIAIVNHTKKKLETQGTINPFGLLNKNQHSQQTTIWLQGMRH